MEEPNDAGFNDETIGINEMQGDLDYLKKQVMDNHPVMKDKNIRGQFEEKIDAAYEKLDSIKKKDEFVFLVMEILAALKDGHTAVDLYNGDYKAIDLNFKWLNEGMIINENADVLKKGDKILTIGDMTPENILSDMKNIISSENDYWVKYKTEQFLPTEMFLNHLGLINNEGKVDVVIENNRGRTKNIQLELNKDINIMDKYYNQKPFYYEINKKKSTGIFYLNFCIYDEQFKKELKEFFLDINKNKIKKVVIDLRRNPGGQDLVIREFLKYIDIDKVELLNDVSFNVSPNKQVDLFYGEIYVLASKETFSSAHGFAGIFKNNHIGLLVGEPTGNGTLSYGNTLKHELPNSKIKFNVATKSFKIPKTELDSDTLEPDVHIVYTRQDIILNNDPVIDWINNCS